jgi:hypothetical protein
MVCVDAVRTGHALSFDRAAKLNRWSSRPTSNIRHIAPVPANVLDIMKQEQDSSRFAQVYPFRAKKRDRLSGSLAAQIPNSALRTAEM